MHPGTAQGWTALSSTPILSVTIDGKLEIKKQGGGAGLLGVQQSINATSGVVYDFSIFIENGFTSNATIVLELLDPNNTVIYTQSVGNGSSAAFTHQFTASTTGTYLVKVYRTGNQASGSYFIDDALITHEEEVTQTLCEDFAGYRYGFNGMEKDDEVKGGGNSYDFGARIYDPRISTWLSPDALSMAKPFYSPYAFALGNPIRYIDSDGNFEVDAATAEKYKKLKPALEKLRNKISEMGEDAKFLVALKKYSGLTKDQMLYALEDGKGPKLTHKDLTKVQGTYDKEGKLTGYKTIAGKDAKDNTGANAYTVKGRIYDKDGETISEGELQLSEHMLDLLEDDSFSEEDVNSVIELFESTITHEIVHFGDHARPLKGEAIKNSETYEVGKEFEIEAYGKDVSLGNRTNKVKLKAIENDNSKENENE